MRATGSRSFYYWYGKVKGLRTPVKHHIGGDEFSVDLARQRATEALVKARTGIDPNAELRERRTTDRARCPLGDLWQKYHDEFLLPRAKSKTIESHVSVWNTWLAQWKDRAVSTIEGEDVRRLHALIAAGRVESIKREGRGAGKRKLGGRRTANKSIALLRRIFNFNRADNPIRPGVIEMFRQHSRERYLTPPELKRFFEALAQEPDEAARDFIELALYTGARRGNVQSMRWDELDLDGHTWRIPGAKTKTGKPVDVPLTPPALELLKRRQAENGRRKQGPSPFVLWSNRAKAGHITEPKFAFARICNAAKIRDLRIHDLRRTLGSWQAALGSSLPIIGRSLGHANVASTAIYARLNIDPVRASVGGAVEAMMLAVGRSTVVKPEQGKETK